MSSTKATARRVGLLYVAMSILSILGYMYLPSKYYVPGDAAATAARIAAGSAIYRLSILNAFAGQILFLFVVLGLYQLFKDVDRKQARLMATLVCVGVAAEIVNIGWHTAPLVLLSGADWLSAFTRPQLDALAFGSLRVSSAFGQIITGFWGLWLFPFGGLTIKSGLFPRVLGWLLFASGVGYCVTCTASIVFPDQLAAITRVVFPLYFGELGMVLWLPLVGAREPAHAPAPAEGR
jgi:hypothetical protein